MQVIIIEQYLDPYQPSILHNKLSISGYDYRTICIALQKLGFNTYECNRYDNRIALLDIILREDFFRDNLAYIIQEQINEITINRALEKVLEC